MQILCIFHFPISFEISGGFSPISGCSNTQKLRSIQTNATRPRVSA